MINRKLNRERKIDSLIFWGLFTPSLILMIQFLVTTAGIISHEVSKPIALTTSGVLILIALPHIFGRNWKLGFTVYITTLLFVLATFALYPENEKYIFAELPYLLLICIPSFLGISSIQNMSLFKNNLLYFAYIMFGLSSLYPVLHFVRSTSLSDVTYEMSYSYYLLLPAMVFYFNRNMLVNIFFFILILLLVLFFGSRGALMSITVYVLLQLFFAGNHKQKFLTATIGAMIALYFTKFIKILASVADDLQITSRSLSLLESNEIITHDSGRNVFYKRLIDYLSDLQIIGKGLWGDRILLSGGYSHNIILEILVDFGVILGVFILGILIFYTVVTFKKAGKINLPIYLLFFCNGFLPLLVSDSFLKSTPFWLFLGSLVLFNRKREIKFDDNENTAYM